MPCSNQAASAGRVRAYHCLLLVCLASATGCTVGPDYQPPQGRLRANWSGATTAPATQPAAAAVAADLARWWAAFNDPALTSLVDRAAKANLDLQQAQARIRQARAARAGAAAGLGPSLDAGTSFRRGRNSGATPITNQYQAGFDAAWELDVFGGIRRGVEAADADLSSAIESYRDVLVTLMAEVAAAYVDLRTYQERAAIARQNLKAQQHSADLTRQRRGFVGGLDVANADAQVATTAAQIPLLESSARQTIYSLSVLLGQEPEALVEELSGASKIPAAPPAVPTGVPSDLLRRRPDIRGAEADVHAATARVGVATADLFPKFGLSGSAGFQAGQLKSWFDWVSRFWSFGPAISWRLFDTGAIRANIARQEALRDEASIVYRRTVLNAMQEVENALVALAKEQEHRESLVAAVAANRKAVELATQLYTQGQTDFLNVLQTQRALYSTEDALTQSTSAVSTDLVALYKALGGGWQEPPRVPGLPKPAELPKPRP